MLMEYDMFDSQKLYVGKISNHGVIKAPFGCVKVIISETDTSIFIEQRLPGIFSPQECLEWLGNNIKEII